MIEFLPLTALRILLIGVAAGFVDGVTAPIIPTGFAISIIPFCLSSLITPTVFTPFKSLRSPNVFLLFLLILSSALPSPVESTAKFEISLFVEGLHKAHATAVTASSTCS